MSAALRPATTAADRRLDAAAIDASCAVPVAAFYVSAALWLVVGTGLALLASVKMHTPEFFDGAAILSFGRIRPAHLITAVYGWASMAGIGTLLWLTARQCRTRLPYGGLLLAGCVLWNAGVAGGACAVLAGGSTGIEWLEMPREWALLLAAALFIVLLASLTMLAGRHERHIHVSHWYLLAAVVWFPLLYALANMLVHGGGLRGVAQATAGWWFAHNLLGLWLVPIGLGTAYYLLPKVLGRPIHSYWLALVGFWTLAVVYNWAGTHHLIGGPLPAWLATVGIVASVLMLIPVVAVGLNHHLTLRGRFSELRRSLVLRFIVVGAMSYVLVSVQGALQALRSINEVTHFTHCTVAHAHLGVYAFFTMTMFGAMYHAGPRLTGQAWGSPLLAELHFWSCAAGIGLYWIGLTIGGLLQGLLLNDPEVPFAEVTARTIPYLGLRSVAAYLMTTGHLVFAWLMLRLYLGRPAGIAPAEEAR